MFFKRHLTCLEMLCVSFMGAWQTVVECKLPECIIDVQQEPMCVAVIGRNVEMIQTISLELLSLEK